MERPGVGGTPEFETWVEALFARHLADLTASEVGRALGALTQDYVQRRERLRGREVLAGRGKRAASALYYAPRHYLLVREVLQRVGAAAHRPERIVDLGCGIGVAGAAWSGLYVEKAPVLGVDVHPWSLDEARATYRALGIPGRALRSRLEKLRWPPAPAGIVLAFTANELERDARDRLLDTLRRRVREGGGLLVVEPLATRAAPWWPEWAGAFVEQGGRADEWHLDVEVPERVLQLGRAAHLDPFQLGARTVWVAPRAASEDLRA